MTSGLADAHDGDFGLIDRFERVDRRLAQQDQRLGRIDQRSAETADRLEVVRLELLERLEALALAMVSTTDATRV